LLAAVFVGAEAAQLFGVQIGDVAMAFFVRPCGDGGEVAAVGVEGVRGHLPFDGEVGEEVVDRLRSR
jgi:hypothetical protein